MSLSSRGRAALTVAVVGASILAVVYGVWRLSSLRRSSPASRTVSRAAEADLAALREASFTRPSASPSGELESLEPRLKRLLATSAAQAHLDEQRKQQLAKLASERLSMYLQPDFDRYAQEVEQLTGKRPDDAEREAWEKAARAFADDIELDLNRIEVRPLVAGGAQVTELAREAGGHYTYRSDPAGAYTTVRDPIKEGADVYAVLVPARVTGVKPEKGSAVRQPAYFVMEYLYDPKLRRWTPWRAGLYDPSSDHVAMAPPWL